MTLVPPLVATIIYSWQGRSALSGIAHCVVFIENALFRSFGIICWPLLPSLLDNRDSDGLKLRPVCRPSNSSYNSTDSSLIIANYQHASYLSLCFCWYGMAHVLLHDNYKWWVGIPCAYNLLFFWGQYYSRSWNHTHLFKHLLLSLISLAGMSTTVLIFLA